MFLRVDFKNDGFDRRITFYQNTCSGRARSREIIREEGMNIVNVRLWRVAVGSEMRRGLREGGGEGKGEKGEKVKFDVPLTALGMLLIVYLQWHFE